MPLQNQLLVVDNCQERAEYEVMCGDVVVMKRREYIEKENRVYIADYTHNECYVKICPR